MGRQQLGQFGGGGKPEPGQPERRDADRADRTVQVEISGVRGAYAGQTIEVSSTGALIWITDERFAGPDVVFNFVRYGERAVQEFSQGMGIRFGDAETAQQAELVRVQRLGRPRGDTLGLACRFTSPLPEEIAQLLELGAPRRSSNGGAQQAAAIVENLPYSLVDASKVLAREPEPEAAFPGAPGASRPAPPSTPPSAPPAARAPADSQRNRERRAATRQELTQPLQLFGKQGSYEAESINYSERGILLRITDEDFNLSMAHDQLVEFTRKLGEEFGDGMLIRFKGAGFTIHADVARVNERYEDGRSSVVIGSRFRRPLTRGECERLRIEPPAPVKAPPVIPVEPRDFGGETRVRSLMGQAVEAQATDLHLKRGVPPRMRVSGSLLDVGRASLTEEGVHAMAVDLMTSAQSANFEIEGDVELSCLLDGVGRFRVNVLRQRGSTSLAIRCIPDKVPTLESLGLAPLARTLAERPRGLVLVTGPTGSGKSTSLAAMIDHVNRTRSCHVLTMEDPIEYVHTDIMAHITQREIGHDAVDFASALRRALRQDPDVIMVGEMRDLETISHALTAAETGHLVFATLHTSSAAMAPDRIIDVFPAGQQAQIRQQLADSLQGVMAQMLVPRIGEGLALVQETLVATDAVRSLIRESKAPQIANLMQTGGKDGMQTLESALTNLVARGVISYKTAVSKANVPKQVHRPEDGRAHEG